MREEGKGEGKKKGVGREGGEIETGMMRNGGRGGGRMRNEGREEGG